MKPPAPAPKVVEFDGFVGKTASAGASSDSVWSEF
jgi:hypothetical protein